jgi:hypothetical protein
MNFSIHGLKVTEGGRRFAPAIFKVQRCTQRWRAVLTNACWLGCDGNTPKPEDCVTITSVSMFCHSRLWLTRRFFIASLSQLAIHHITNMLNPSKKNGPVCQSVLQAMETNVQSPRPESRATAISIPPGMKYLPELWASC